MPTATPAGALASAVQAGGSPAEEELRRLRQENVRLKARRPLHMKVATKGGVSVYGLGRFPVTLYREQWLKLLEMEPDIRAFIEANASKLRDKPS